MPSLLLLRKKPVRNLLLSLLVIALLLAVYAGVIEPGRLVVTETTIRLPRWPAEFEGLRIAALSDLHVGFGMMTLGRLREVVARTNEQNPDLILLAGDYVAQRMNDRQSAKVDPEVFAEELGKLRARHGVFAVLGNHEWWYGPARVRKALEGAGVIVLDNDAVQIASGGGRIWLAGIGDDWTNHDDVPKTLSRLTDDSAAIAFTHTPDVFAELPARFGLLVAGHTHGGQINLPLVGAPAVPSRYSSRYLIGHIVEDGRHLFVTPGLGMSVLPVRFRVPPEISVIRIVRE